MATREELMQALRAADAAGDTAAATAIAKRLQTGATAAPAQPPAQPAQAAPERPSLFSETPEQQAARRAKGEERVQHNISTAKGVQDAILKNALAVKQLFGGLSPDDRGVLDEMKKDVAADPYGPTREAGGSGFMAGMTAVPAAGAANVVGKGLSFLPKALQWLKPMLTAATVSGVQGGVQHVGEGETYGEQMADKGHAAMKDAAIGGALAGGGQVLTKALTQMFKPTQEAVRLMDEGITPTLQQGADSSAGRFVGGLTSGAVNVTKRQNKEVLDAFMRRVAPGVDTSDMTVPETVTLLRDKFPKEYESLFAGRVQTITPTIRRQIWDEARGASQPAAVENATEALGTKTGPAIAGGGTAKLTPRQVQEYRNLLSDAADQFKGKGEIKAQTFQALLGARNKFDELVRTKGLSPDEMAQLSDIDSRMSDFLRYQDAATNPGFHARPRVAEVMRSYAKMGDNADFATAASPTQRELLEPATRVMGLTPTQDESRALISALKRAGKGVAAAGVGGSAVLGNPVAMAAAPFYAASLAGQTAPGAKALFGQYPAQQQLSAFLRGSAPYVSNIGAYGEQ